MRTIIIILIYILGTTIHLQGQVGINTTNPQTIFHVDEQGNNPATTTPDKTQQADDITIKNTNGSISMGIGIIPDDNSGIQLEMGGENSAFLPNRIALKSLDDLTTIPNPVDGMLIYNTTDNSALDLHPGIYYFGEGKWVSVFTSEVVSTIEYRDLSGNFSPNNTDTKAHERPDNATTLSWKDPNNPTLAASSYIEIPEDGSYAFSFRLYGSHVTNGPLREVFYLWALRNNSTLAADRLDVAELNIPLAYEATTNKRNLSYTVTLTAICRKGEKIYFRVGIPNNYPACTLIGNPKTSTSQDPVPNRTSMIFWKL